MGPEDLIARGFHLFPLKGKTPFVKWRAESSTDLTTIRNWKAKFPNCGWGIDCGKSNLAVLDVDSGKCDVAEDNLDDLLISNGYVLPPTLRVRTVSGGYHLYYHGAVKNSASDKLGVGLDTRGEGGFVVAPCSPGYAIAADHPIADCPDWLTSIVGLPSIREKAAPVPGFVYDTPTAIDLATKFLSLAPPALMGEGGNDHIYRVAAQTKDYGVSCDTAIQLMLAHWYPRCEPNDRFESLARIAANGYHYGSNPPGISNPELAFPPLTDTQLADLEAAPVPIHPKAPRSLFIDVFDLLSQHITVDYLIDSLIETPATGLMFGESSAGKSFLAIALALSVAYRTAWLNNDVSKPGPVFYLAGEGQKGIPRRIKAWLKHHDIKAEPGKVRVSRSRIEFDAKSAEKMRQEIEQMSIEYGKPSLIIIDTLARHLPGTADENSAKDIGAFINAVDYIKDAFQCVMLIVHHSGKKQIEMGRGSSALKAAMDFEIQVRPGVVSFTKQKDGELPEPFGFDLLNVEIEFGVGSAVPVPSALDAVMKTVKLSKQERLSFDCLRMTISAAGVDKIKVNDWKADFYANLGNITDNAKESAFKRTRAKLQKVGAISVEEGLVWLNRVSNDD
jgi:hypothetical protein